MPEAPSPATTRSPRRLFPRSELSLIAITPGNRGSGEREDVKPSKKGVGSRERAAVVSQPGIRIRVRHEGDTCEEPNRLDGDDHAVLDRRGGSAHQTRFPPAHAHGSHPGGRKHTLCRYGIHSPTALGRGSGWHRTRYRPYRRAPGGTVTGYRAGDVDSPVPRRGSRHYRSDILHPRPRKRPRAPHTRSPRRDPDRCGIPETAIRPARPARSWTPASGTPGCSCSS